MKKLLPYILILLLLFGTVGQQYYINAIKNNFITLIETVQELIEPKPDFDRLKLATIQIKVGKAGGAGIIYKVDEKYLYVLTVKHALKQKGNIEMWIYNNKKEFVKIKNIPRKNTYKSKKVDLGLIKILKPKGNFVFIPLAKKTPNIGDRIYTIGHPLRFYYSINTGLITNYTKRIYQNIKSNYMIVSAPAYRGNSGGAVINVDNELIGIVSGVMYLSKGTFSTGIDKLHNITFSVRLEDITNFLKEIE